MNKHLRTVLDIIKKQGCQVLERREGKHWVFKLITEAGKTFLVTTGKTPSDWRTYKNLETTIRNGKRTST